MKVLFVSGSIGLGHITRDLTIANAIRARCPDVEITWLAAEPAATVLRRAGEPLHPRVAEGYRSDTAVADRVSGDGELSLLTYAFAAYREWTGHALLVRRLLQQDHYDLVLGDETYELLVAQIFHLLRIPVPFVLLYDFLGLDAMSTRWGERLGVYLWNAIWSRDRRVLTNGRNLGIFIGEPADIPDSPFGPLLPHRRQHAQNLYEFVGYVLPFDPTALDRSQVRAELGYGSEPLVVGSVGGLSVGRDLLELCGRAFTLARRTSPDLHMVLVCGPSISPDTLDVPAGVDVRGFVPDLYKHFAASDLAIVQAGGTTTLELSALKRPFVYFPVAGQCEQELTVAARLARHRAGIRMSRATTTPTDLAETIIRNLDVPVDYAPIPVDGANQIAELVCGLM